MADTKISALSAGTALAGTEELPMVQSATTVKVTPAQVKTYSLATPLAVVGNSTAGAELRLPEDTDNGSNYVALKAPDTLSANITWTLPSADGTSGQVLQTNGSGVLSWTTASGGSASAPLTLASGTLTGDSNALTLTQTWNNGSQVFSGALKINVTNTASDATSALADLQVGGTSVWKFRRDGFLQLANDTNTCIYSGFSNQIVFGRAVASMLAVDCSFGGDQGYTKTGSSGAFAWASAGGATNGADLRLLRAASNVLQVTTTSSAASSVKLGAFTVSGLPAAASHAYTIAFVSDATSTTARSTVSGGGSTKVMVMSDGSNWLIVA